MMDLSPLVNSTSSFSVSYAVNWCSAQRPAVTEERNTAAAAGWGEQSAAEYIDASWGLTEQMMIFCKVITTRASANGVIQKSLGNMENFLTCTSISSSSARVWCVMHVLFYCTQTNAKGPNCDGANDCRASSSSCCALTSTSQTYGQYWSVHICVIRAVVQYYSIWHVLHHRTNVNWLQSLLHPLSCCNPCTLLKEEK